MASASLQNLNQTSATNITATWVSSPNIRGTATILYDCLATILLCIYTALHVDISPTRIGTWRRIWNKTCWVLVAILAPEYIVYNAFVQLRMVRHFRKTMTEVSDKTRKGSRREEVQDEPATVGETVQLPLVDLAGRETPRTMPYTELPDEDVLHNITTWPYAWYVVMGGFVVNVSRIHDLHTHVTITHWGVSELANRGLFLSMDGDAIEDKAKANILGKLLVVFQLLYFTIQCIARATQGLPLTLLEVHTLVHVVCAVALYIAWWHKPFDVAVPTSIDDKVWRNSDKGAAEGWQRCIANLLMCSTWLQSWHGSDPHTHTQDTWPEMVFCADISSSNVTSNEKRTIGNGEIHFKVYDISDLQLKVAEQKFYSVPESQVDAVPPTNLTKVQTGQAFVEGITVAWLKDSIKDNSHQSGYDSGGHLSNQRTLHKNTMWFSGKAIRRWTLGLERREWATPRKANPPRDEKPKEDHHFPYFEPKRRDFSSLSYDRPPWTIWLSAIATCVYGGVHTLAWNFSFPSNTEQLLWRISSIALIAFGPAFTELLGYSGALNHPTMGGKFAYIVFGQLWIDLKALGTSVWKSPGSWGHYGFDIAKALGRVARSLYCHSLSVVWLPSLVMARLFFIVDPFLAFRRVPTDVYTTPNWNNYIPHLS